MTDNKLQAKVSAVAVFFIEALIGADSLVIDFILDA
ncbi:hypothetical protein ABNIH4_00500 [Acinetobacter baumannii ABNIH4]|nr:hypothetical protein ABNIH4_00500 [Acinetobacter baumannii ABNIH4]